MVKFLTFLAIFCINFYANELNTSAVNNANIISHELGINKMSVKFVTSDSVSPKLFIKAIEHSLNKISVSIESVDEFINLDVISYLVEVEAQNSINVAMIQNALSKNGLNTTNTSFQNGRVVLNLDAKNINIKGDAEAIDGKVRLTRSNVPYLLNVRNFNKAQIVSDEPNTWIPLIRLYDNNFNKVAKLQEFSIHSNYDVNLSGARYMLLGDNISMNNIKNEIVVKLIK
ncbi:hypothetical protein KDE13_03800 [Campylobacter sp. faydin G-140]|uniref:hypothetical protein n=1 Tax=Campylobacter anatolicus TaxID=2829105 RepID=UPI001B9E369A|nr:hypothetical protein [Campylobacter anatolicus]MBR8465484.1 hypothetical protein [Campylobacter anatolicus]